MRQATTWRGAVNAALARTLNLLAKALFGLAGVALFTVAFWSSLSHPQQDWVMHKFGLYQPVPQVTQYDRVRVAAPAADSAPATPQPVTPPLLQGVEQTFEQHDAGADCKVTSRSITDVDNQARIYRWVSADGQVHYGGRQPRDRQSRDLTGQYASKTQYFTLDLASPDGQLPPLLGENLRRDVTAIYSYLSERLQRQHLRQSLLSLKVFDTKAAFNAHKQAVAPTLRTVAGFYSGRRNEAVVMRQRHDAQTRAIARHEATHVINAALFGPTPEWFNEGLAEYFEGHTHAELKGLATPSRNYHLVRLTELLRKKQLPALAEYLSLSGRAWRQRDPHDMYAIAWSVINYLLDHAEGDQLIQVLMQQMATDSCAAVDALSLWQQHYPGGLEVFERRWLAKLRAAAG